MLLQDLTPSRGDVADAMLFCLQRTDAAKEVVRHVADSFSLPQTPLQKKASALDANRRESCDSGDGLHWNMT